jgi:hypothetical protein
MENLPEDIQNLIWRKVYDGCLVDIEEGYAIWARQRRNTIYFYENSTEVCKYYFREVQGVYKRRKNLKWEPYLLGWRL